MPRPVVHAPEPLTDSDCFAILDQFGAGPCGRRNVALLMTMWRTGLRLDECLSVQPRDLKPGPPAELRVRRGKGATTRVVGVRADAWAALTVWLAVRSKRGIPTSIDGEATTVFCTLTGKKLDGGYVRRTFAEKAKRAGVLRRVHPHGLRHTFASNMSRAGQPIEIIRDALGHSTLAVTDHYLRVVSGARVIDAMTREGKK